MESAKSNVMKEDEYFRLKAEVEEDTKKDVLYIPLVLVGILSFLFIFPWNNIYKYGRLMPPQVTLLIFIVCVILSVFISFLAFWMITSLFLTKKRKKIRAYELSLAQDEAEDKPFQNSIKTSYKYLDSYYDQTQRQAQQGFHITVVIAIFGALLIFGGVTAMYAGFIQPAYITCASGAITELISAIFFYLYNKTVTSMSRYHNKLVLSQNISFALRVADSLSEEKKDDAKLVIIGELIKDVNAQMMKSDNDADEPSESEKLS